MLINLIYDPSVNTAPAAFKTAMAAAASFLDELIVNPITVNIQVGYGEDDDGAFPIGANLSLGGAFYQSFVNYSTLKNDLLANATTALDRLAVGSLPPSDPTDGATFAVGDAEARALGLLPATSTVIDGAVGFNDTYPWNYNTDGQAAAGEFDFVSDAELELIHALGMALGTPSGGSTAFMLFRYSAPGMRELTVNSDGVTTPASYFSIDGGGTNLGNYLTYGDSTLFNAGGPIGINDTLAAPYPPGQEHVFSMTDALELNVLGFDVNTLPTTNFSVLDTTTNIPLQTNGTPYSGPVAGLQWEYIYTGSDNLNVTANVPNVFIHTGSGEDAINVSSAGGNNVLDGSTGSNFLVGGSGDDTFFVDDRSPSADIWSTVSNFHAGDAATIFGITQSGFDTSWVNGQGATGYTGLTLHVTAPGVPTASLTLAGLTLADLSNGQLSTSWGTESDGTPYLYVHANTVSQGQTPQTMTVTTPQNTMMGY
jgi:hypothetical protein